MQQPVRVRRALPVPHVWPIGAVDAMAVALINALVIVGMWVRHGGLDQFGTLGGIFTATGQITALLGTYLALIGLVLMSRSPWLEQLFGMDRLVGWHRWVGFGTVWLLLAHTVFTTLGYAATARLSILDEASSLLTTYPYVLMATVAMAMLVALAVASVRAARRRLSYETWYGIHLYGYLAIALAFAHELAVGTDFTTDRLAQAYWVALYVVVVALIVVFRIGQPVQLFVRHRFRVANVVRESPEAVSIYIAGRELDQLPVRAGQFFVFRFLAGGGWWRAHPFSLSAAPNGQYLRITVKDSGDDSRVIQRVRIGTRVFLEGPYGAFTGARRRHPRVLLIAGGIGVTPLRALLEELPMQPGAFTLLYRASSWEDVVFRDELDALARVRGATIHYLVGRRSDSSLALDPLDPRSLRRLVPDVHQRDVYVCGPDEMMDAVRSGLRSLGLPNSQIHAERFAF